MNSRSWTGHIIKTSLILDQAIYIMVGSRNGIYGIKSPFPAPTGSARESTGILFIFTKGCFLSDVVSHKNNQERQSKYCTGLLKNHTKF